jgi:hypothetical protein
MSAELSWKPVLKDGVYCSPACGGGKGICDKSKYDKAVRDSTALAKKMGNGWNTYVHENLGWFWTVYKGKPANGIFGIGLLEINPSSGGGYTAWVQSSPQFICHHRDPKIALRMAIKEFDAHLAALNKQRDAIGKMP